MTITIHQPEHLPWTGFFNKIAKAEKFVILDSVQYEKNYPVYPQRRAEQFIAYLSALDLFMNCGFEESKEIIMRDNEGLASI